MPHHKLRSFNKGLSRMYVLAFWSISDQALGLYSHHHFWKHQVGGQMRVRTFWTAIWGKNFFKSVHSLLKLKNLFPKIDVLLLNHTYFLLNHTYYHKENQQIQFNLRRIILLLSSSIHGVFIHSLRSKIVSTK